MVQAKRLRITVENKSYDVTVEFLDEGGCGGDGVATAVARSAAVVPAAVVTAPSASSAPVASTPTASGEAKAGGVVSPMAGVVAKILVNKGERVSAGQDLVILEAMKMETPISAVAAGVVDDILVRCGDSVLEEQLLLRIV